MPNSIEHYRQLFSLLEGARMRPVEERDAWLRDRCGADEALRAEAEELLASLEDDGEDAFSEQQIAGVRGALERLIRADDPGGWIPERIGRYRILRRIGEGGMGVVYEALQESPRRSVAIKLLHPQSSTPERRRRFRQEAELLGRLHHPGIAQVFEAGTFDAGSGEQPYFAMELIDGVGLLRFAEREGLVLAQRLELMARIAEAVHHAHERGIVHRDLKPENILVDGHGQPKVLDFGVARAHETEDFRTSLATRDGVLLGTLAYMAPEQVSGEAAQISPRTDVFALGIITYELLTDRLPHNVAGLPIGEAMRVLSDRTPPPVGSVDSRLRGDIETMLAKALELEPGRRYDSAAAFAADLRRFLSSEPITARRASGFYRARKFARRHSGLVAGGALALAALVAGLVVSLRFAFVAEEKGLDASRRATELAQSLRREQSARQLVEEKGAELAQALEREQNARREVEEQGKELERSLASEQEALRESEENRSRLEDALDGEQEARRHAESHRMALQSASIEHDPVLALQLALAAAERYESAEARRSLYEALGDLRELRRLEGHEGYVFHAVVAPDGSRFASADWSGLVLVRNAAGLEIVHRLDPFEDMDPDVARRELGLPAGANPTTVQALAFSRDGLFLLAGSLEGRVVVWDASSGEVRADLPVGAPVYAAVFGRDAGEVLTADHAGRVLRWTLGGEPEPELLLECGAPVQALDARAGVVACLDREDVLRVVDRDGAPRIELRPDPERRVEPDWSALGIEVEPRFGEVRLGVAGRLLVRRSVGPTSLVDVDSGTALLEFHDPTARVSAIEWSPAERWLLLSWRRIDGMQLELHDLESGVRVPLPADLTRPTFCEHAVFAADERSVAIADEGVVNVVSLPEAERRAVFEGPGRRVLCITQLPNGAFLTGLEDRTLRVWGTTALPVRSAAQRTDFETDAGFRLAFALDEDRAGFEVLDLASGATVLRERLAAAVLDHAFDPEGQRLATLDAAGTLRIHDLAAGSAPVRVDGAVRGAPHGARLVFDRRGDRIAVLDRWDPVARRESRVSCFAATGGERLWQQAVESDLVIADFSPDGALVATADGMSATFTVRDARDGAVVHRSEPRVSWMVDVAFGPDGALLAAAAVDTQIHLHETAGWANVGALLQVPQTDCALSWSPDATQLAVSFEGRLPFARVYDVASRSLHVELTVDEPASVGALSFAPAGDMLGMRVGGEVRLLPTDPVAWAREHLPRPIHSNDMIRFQVGTEAEIADARYDELLGAAWYTLTDAAVFYATNGYLDRARQILEHSEQRRPRVVERPRHQFALAVYHATLAGTSPDAQAAASERSRAMSALAIAVGGGEYSADLVEHSGLFAALAEEPAFAELLAELRRGAVDVRGR